MAVRINVGNIVKPILAIFMFVNANFFVGMSSGVVFVIMIAIVMLVDLVDFENLQVLPRR